MKNIYMKIFYLIAEEEYQKREIRTGIGTQLSTVQFSTLTFWTNL